MTTQGPPEPDETQPFTHQPYGEGSGDPAPQWPTYDAAGAAPPPPPPNPYGPPTTYGQPGYGSAASRSRGC